MSDPQSEPSVSDASAEQHTHHWLIGNQDGPSSPGVCKDCGERRDFSNSFERRKPAWMPRSNSARQETPGDSPDGDGP